MTTHRSPKDWAPVLIWCSVIFGAGTFNSGIGGKLLAGDKFTHILTYGILGIVIARSVEASSLGEVTSLWQRALLSPILFALVMSTAIGAIDEIHQSFVPGRFGSFEDVVADSIGGLFGAWIFLLAGRNDSAADELG